MSKATKPTQVVRSLAVIAREIGADWKQPYFGAVPYLRAMQCLDKATDHYGYDSAEEIVLRFLGNATTWRGEKARAIKKELKSIVWG